jgi:hypothetical protein
LFASPFGQSFNNVVPSKHEDKFQILNW